MVKIQKTDTMIEDEENDLLYDDDDDEYTDDDNTDELYDIDTNIETGDIEIGADIEYTEKVSDQEMSVSKHTIQGTHALKYDSIFKGKKDDPINEDSLDFSPSYNEGFELDKSSSYWNESVDNETYVKKKILQEKIYNVLSNHTNLIFTNSRRKPSKTDFNNYYTILKNNLQQEGFSNVEIFNELAVYFSDNMFNMFKLLDSKWKNAILAELQDHIGKQTYSNEIINRNIYVTTEIEFLHENINSLDGELIHITGVVVETDYPNSLYKVNSYERIYVIHLDSITKILNNRRIKYNQNKLNSIDFL